MKIGVISDTHGSISAWKNVIDHFFRDMDLIIHCGDVLYHGPRNPLPEGYDPANLATEINAFEKPIVFAKGNCDSEVDQLLIETPLQSPYAQVFVPCWKILVHHGHLFNAEEIPDWANKFDLIVSGHTHLPQIKKQDTRIMLNPGSPALPKNNDKTPTIAIIEDLTIKLINVKTGEIISQLTKAESKN